MSKKDKELQILMNHVERIRKYTDEKLLRLTNMQSFHIDKVLKQAFNIVLKERGLK